MNRTSLARLLVPLACVTGVTTGCGGQSPDSSRDDLDASWQCLAPLDLTNARLVTAEAGGSASAPLATGGSIAPGDYVLGWRVFYGTTYPPIGAAREALHVTSDAMTFDTQAVAPGSDTSEGGEVGTVYAVNGNVLLYSYSCGVDGGAPMVPVTFSASDSQLTLRYELGSGVTQVDLFAKM